MLKEIMIYLIPILFATILGVASKYLIPALRLFLEMKTKELAAMAKSARVREMIYRIGDLIDDCVVATNQNYVEKLKGTDGWTKEAQAEALKMTTSAVMSLITAEMMELLQETFRDSTKWINTKIDKSVNVNKATK